MHRLVSAILACALFGISAAAFAQTVPESAPTTLRGLIEEKAKELQAVQNQRDAVQKNLDEISKSSESLKKEIRTIDSNINQLNFSVKANALTLEKLDLEIEETAQDIEKHRQSIANKRDAMAKLFVDLQARQHESLLVVLLRSTSLSESLAEVEAITTLNSSLRESIRELDDLQTELTDSLDLASVMKQEREVEQVNLKNRKAIVSEIKEEKQQVLDETKSKEAVYQQQLAELKKTQDAISDEIEGYESVLRKTIDPNALPLPRTGVLEWPVGGGTLTQGYGRTSFAIRTYSSQWHNGIDIGGAIGLAIYAAEDGVIINAGNQDAYRGCRKAGYGKFVVVKHDNGLTTLYGHLSRYIVTVGQTVKRGDVIAYLGNTGWATGPHLHFTVFASQTLSPAKTGFPEGTRATNSCGPMPVGGDLDPELYVDTQ
jgi:murein DD-endopeptidase MepM/ murein hydrolase activator NlpD